MRIGILLLIFGTTLSLSAGAAGKTPTRVAVIGTMHQLHETMPGYGYADLRKMIQGYAPDVLCVELQPQDLTERPEEKNKREYPNVVYPLIDAGHYRIYAMEPDEPMFSRIVKSLRGANARFRKQSPDKAERLDAYIAATYKMLESYWKSPAMVNDRFTDSVFQTKHAVQSEFIGPDEARGWNAWNTHMLSVIDKAVQENPGRKVAVIVGAEHGYWLRSHLGRNTNVRLVETASLSGAKGASQ